MSKIRNAPKYLEQRCRSARHIRIQYVGGDRLFHGGTVREKFGSAPDTPFEVNRTVRKH